MGEPDPTFASLAGVIAHGRDFRATDEQSAKERGRQATRDEEHFVIRSGSMTRTEDEETEAAIARGELEAIERSTEQEGLVASLTAEKAADWLGISDAELNALPAAGAVTAFVCRQELRHPGLDFTEDPVMPAVPGLTRLRPTWGADHPTLQEATLTAFELHRKEST